jgi:hypothetical protein
LTAWAVRIARGADPVVVVAAAAAAREGHRRLST